MNMGSATQKEASSSNDMSNPVTLVFSGQLITSQNAPLTPLYQLSRDIACATQKHCSIIFEKVQVVEATKPHSVPTKRRHLTQDLFYLPNPLFMPLSQPDTPACYLTAASPEALGNVELLISETSSQKPEITAMLNADKSAADVQLFNRKTQQKLFDIKPKLKGGHYEWIDADQQIVAYEMSNDKEHRLFTQVPLEQGVRDALVALWVLRLWYDLAEKERAEQ